MAANVYKGICEFLNAENLEVNQDDLRDPSPELVHFLYAALARISFDLDEKAYTKDVATAAAQLEAHHHERSFSLIKTVNLVGRFCKDAEVFGQSEQFSYADVISPKRDRTRLVLQSLIGFIEFKRQHTLDVRQVYDEADEKERVLHDDKFKRDAVKDHATRLRQDLDSARRKKAEHMQRCVELRQKVLELQTVAQNHEEACKQKRDEYTSLEETMKQTRMELAKASDKNRELETNIVHSPDELNAEIHRMEQELQQAVGECEQYAKTAEEFDKDLKRLEDVENAMENLSSDLQQLEAEWEALAPLRKEKDDTDKKISDAKITLQLLEEQRQAILDEQEARRTELKLSQNAQLHEQQTYEQQLATNKTALKELTEQEREARSEATRLRRAVDDKTKAYDQLEVDFDAAIEELTQRFLEVKQYMEDRTAEIEEVREIARPVLDRL